MTFATNKNAYAKLIIGVIGENFKYRICDNADNLLKIMSFIYNCNVKTKDFFLWQYAKYFDKW